MKKICLVLLVAMLLLAVGTQQNAASQGTQKVVLPMILKAGGRASGSVSVAPLVVTQPVVPVPTKTSTPVPTFQPTVTDTVPEPTNLPTEPIVTVEPTETVEPPDPTEEPACGSWSASGPHPCPGGTNGGSEHKGPGFPDPTP